MTYAEFSIAGEQILLALRGDHAWRGDIRARYAEFLKGKIEKTETRIAAAIEKFPNPGPVIEPIVRLLSALTGQLNSVTDGAEFDEELAEYRIRIAKLPEPK